MTGQIHHVCRCGKTYAITFPGRRAPSLVKGTCPRCHQRVEINLTGPPR